MLAKDVYGACINFSAHRRLKYITLLYESILNKMDVQLDHGTKGEERL